MLQRLYVHNYRCLENFELIVKGIPSALLIGKNGSGKSTIARVLELFQSIAQGVGLDDRAIQILPEVGGWKKVLAEFIGCHCSEMRSHPARMMVLLIDFDNQYTTRFPYFRSNIPCDLQERVFVLGVWSEPEQLKRELGCVGFEKIGEALAKDCYENSTQTWGHELLEHNESELHRMMAAVKPFLFS